jgi:4-amino-4-deoxy-L-arabinose transferase-like glycosyltransferase
VKSVYRIWWIALLAKLLLSVAIPLSQDEAYYWVWSKTPQLSYFDHPPMVAWLLWLGHWLEPWGQAVRWPAVILGHLTLLVWIQILKPALEQNFAESPDSRLRWWMALMLSSPLLGVGSLLATPDVPVVFFWSLSTLLVLQILQSHRLQNYFLLGASLGLGFCSKYHIVLFPVGVALWLTFKRRWSVISWKGLGLTVIAGLIFCSPVLVWNYQHGFESFLFQVNHGLGAHSWDPFWTYSYVTAQIALLFPVTLYFALRSDVSSNYSLLKYLAWFPLAFFVLSSFRGTVEVNWPIVAYPSVYALAVLNHKKLKALLWSIVPWTALAAYVVLILLFPLTQNIPEKIAEVHYFDPIRPIAEEYRPLYFGSYQMASRMWYDYKTPTQKLYQIARHDLFDEVQKQPPVEEKFYVAKETWVPFPAWLTNEKYRVVKIKDVPPKFELDEVTKL